MTTLAPSTTSVQTTTVQKTDPIVNAQSVTTVSAPTTTSNTTTVSSNTIDSGTSSRTVTTTTNTIVSQRTFTTDTTIPFMRAKTVQFTAQGLKPNSRYYPFFNGVYVGDFCSMVSAVRSSALFTDSNGNISGNFYLPGATFTCGQHKFELVDYVFDVNGKIQADPIYSSAEALYTANGILRLQQTQITTTTVNTVSTVVTEKQIPVELCNQWLFDWRETSSTGTIRRFQITYWATTNVAFPPAYTPSPTSPNSTIQAGSWTMIRQNAICPAQRGFGGIVERTDPLAQSFVLDSTKYPNGAFLTSVDIYFRTIDQSSPVFMELRNMVNGLPGPLVLPGGNAFVPGWSTTVSLDATKSTTFKFDFPVYLIPGQEYCIVLKTPSMGYNVWVARFGDNDVTTQKRIITQPIDGVFFRSANNSTWEPDSAADLKCTFKIAAFDTDVQGNLLFRPQRRIVEAPKLTVGKTYRIETVGDTDWAYATGLNGSYLPGTLVQIVNIPSGTGTAYDIYYNLGQSLSLSSMSTTAGSGTVMINIPMHGLQGGDFIYIDDLPDRDYNGISAANLYGEFAISYEDDDNVTITARNDDLADVSGVILTSQTLKVFDTVPPPPVPNQTFDVAEAVTNVGNLSPSTIPGATGLAPAPVLIGSRATFSASDVDIPSNSIELSGYVFATGDHVVYSSNGNTAVNGLSSGATYYVRALTANTVRFYNTKTDAVNDSTGSLAIVLGSDGTGDYHSLTIVDTQVDTSHFTVFANIRINEAMIDYLGTELPSTSIVERVSLADIDYNDQPYVEYNKTGEFYEYDTARILATPKNEYEKRVFLSQLPSLRVNMLLNSNDQFNTPVIDYRGMTLMTRTYRIDNQSDELEPENIIQATELVAGKPYIIVNAGDSDFTTVGARSNLRGTCFIATGSVAEVNEGEVNGTVYLNSEIVPGSGTAISKYKTTVNQIDTDRTVKYDQMSIFVVGSCPDPALIDCYIRTSSDETTHRDLNWNWAPINGVYGTPFNNSSSSKTMTEWRFDYVAPEVFNVFDVKLVFRSTNTSVVPKVYAIRTIANKS